MKNYWLTSSFSFILILLSFWLFLIGCQSSHKTIMRRVPPPPATSLEEAITTRKQNFSMARKLKNHSPSEYILGPEDTVEISVLNHNELKMEVGLSPTGRIPYYYIGDIQAAGLNQFQLRDKIREALTEFIKAPKVVVRITEHRSHKVFVLGQVKSPGVYRIKGEMTLLEAISSAGGVTPDAYLSGAYLVRDGKIMLVNFLELIRKGNTDENIALLSGDIIYIPDKNDHKVFVLGEVNKQSAIPVEEGLTLLGAIARAGGFTRDANRKSIVLLRGNLSEPGIMRINITTEHLLDRNSFAMANLALQRGDILYVPSKLMADVERIAVRLSNILDPLLKVERGIILHDAVKDVLEGEDKDKIIISH